VFGADNGQGDTVTRVFSWSVNPDLRPVPNIVGATRQLAAAILAAAGLSLGSERDVAVTDCALIGQVLDQTPAATAAAPLGSTVAFSLAVKPSGNLRCS
jgi:beta-lactam-binding protein with PASTA domain